MKILLIENETPAAARLATQVREIQPGATIVAVCGTVTEAVNWLNANPSPDLVLMDIQLDDGLCFEIFDAIDIRTPVIFTTAYDAFVMNAFKLNSIDYLLKPIDLAALAAAFAKLHAITATPRPAPLNERIARVQGTIEKTRKTRFLVKVGTQFRSVPVNEISCFYTEGNYVFIRTFANNVYDTDHSLLQLEMLVDPDQFFRINRNYLLNIRAIAQIHSYSASRLKVVPVHDADDTLFVSRDRITAFKLWLDR